MSFYKGNTEIAETKYIKPTATINITENGTVDVTNYATAIVSIQPPITTGGLFTGATIPLTYKDNTHDYENNYEYKSKDYNITITGLNNEAEIIGNGTKNVKVNFDVTSSTSSLTPFTITLNDGTNTYTFNGLHAHYGETVTKILTLAYTNIPPTGTGTIGTEYKFIISDDLPHYYGNDTTQWNTIYLYQVLNTLIGNWSSSTIDNDFLRNCYSFNQPLIIPNTVTTIGTRVLQDCYSFNQPITIPNTVTTIRGYFLSECYSFNQPITIPNGITSIDQDFLYACCSFNQPITIPNGITSIGSSFLRECFSFNQPITIPNSVTSISSYFLSDCYSFNQPITIPNGVTSIGSRFLSSCYSFNQPIIIPNTITSIGANFLYACFSFNQPITIPNSVTSISNYFLYECRSFNQPLTIPNTITSIGTYFLQNCYSFNQPLTIPNTVTSISSQFLQRCFSFNQPITIPNSVTSIGGGFLYECNSLSTIIYESAVYPTDNNSLAQTANSKTSADGAGIKVYGTNRTGLMTALPDRTSSPYRKLIDGGY